MTNFDAAVREALDCVYDPCSVAAGRGTGLYSMGLVLGWRLTHGVLHVEFCQTFTGCTFAPHFMGAAEEKLAALPGITRVETHLNTAFVWTPERMKAAPAPGRPAITPWALEPDRFRLNQSEA